MSKIPASADNQVIAFEKAIAGGVETEEKLDNARLILGNLLTAKLGLDSEQNDLGDAIQSLSKAAIPSSTEATVLLRALAVKELFSDPALARARRFIVELAERNLEELCTYLGSPEKRQTFEKFAALEPAHDRVCLLLSTLRAVTDDIDGIVSSRQQVLSTLNHVAVRTYCAPYGIQNVRTRADTLIKKLSRISKDSALIGQELKECEIYLDEQTAYCERNQSFLATEFFLPFVVSAKNALAKVVKATRSRVRTSIALRISGSNTLQKRYPLHETGREIAISVPLKSTGPGMAGSVVVSIEPNSQAIYFSNRDVFLGPVLPGDFSAAFEALVIEPSPGLEIMVTVRWEEPGETVQREVVFLVDIAAQKADVDWHKLEYQRPYSTEVAKGDAFVGRKDKITALSNKILRQPMESFYVTGQKRIGKTSLALAACESARGLSSEATVKIDYLLWGKIAYDDPRESLRELGERVADFISASLPGGSDARDLQFTGSLAPLVRLAERAQRTAPSTKFVIIIDEFDEIHPELYQQGNLAETFFANLRALTTCENICLCLVGGENMPFVMDRQGQKLNKLVPFHLDYFSRDREWEDFKLLVRKPMEGSLYWHEEAVAEIFNKTNGNPFFAKILCSWVFQDAVRERDADITLDEVASAVSSNLPTLDVNSFAHLWMDGIHKPVGEREPDILRRSRTLAAIARTLRRGQELSLANILSNREGLLLPDGEVPPILNNLVKRRILVEDDGKYSFVLPIFGLWLTEVGATRLLGDALGEELAASVVEANDRAFVQSDEISALVKRWPVYQGRKISGDDVRQWLGQCESHIEQRSLFTVLQSVRFVSEAEIRERLKTLHSMIRPTLPEFVQRRRSERRTDVIITYVDGEGKSGQYFASRYAEENNISSKCIISPVGFAEGLTAHARKHGQPAVLIIIDDIACTGNSLRKNARNFVEANPSVSEVDIVLMVLFATKQGEENVRAGLAEMEEISVDLRYCELLTDNEFAFARGNKVWTGEADIERAKALSSDLGARIYVDNPLGYGGGGLTVVFPNNCPNNSLPILHSRSRPGQQTWEPIFPRMTN